MDSMRYGVIGYEVPGPGILSAAAELFSALHDGTLGATAECGCEAAGAACDCGSCRCSQE